MGKIERASQTWEEQYYALEELYKQLKEKYELLVDEFQELKEKLNTNSKNSSTPPIT